MFRSFVIILVELRLTVLASSNRNDVMGLTGLRVVVRTGSTAADVFNHSACFLLIENPKQTIGLPRPPILPALLLSRQRWPAVRERVADLPQHECHLRSLVNI
jgi:hypothetical protein